MTAFLDNYFFYCLGVMAVPAAALGIAGRRLWQYGLFASGIFILLIYGAPGGGLIYFIVFLLWSYVAAAVYSKLGARRNAALFSVFLTLALLPLAVAKSALGLMTFRFAGISYMTFRTVQFIVGVKEGKTESVRPHEFAYFVLFFPALSSGPIDRLRRFTDDMRARRTREEYLELLRDGIWKFAVGALYSFAIAPAINAYALEPLDAMKGAIPVAAYAYVYTIHLFFNFAGYSALAVGTSCVFGIKTPDNFNMPFLSRDMKEFWTRWHVSLSSFFRDYIYGKFVAACLKRRAFGNSRAASYLGAMLTMLVMGVWHGYGARFIVYGVYHGAFMCANEWLDIKTKWFKRLKKHTFGSILCTFFTFHIVAFGMLIFSGKLF
ncbi:MAG: D-alanyl-lipoteichoic acid biosynthesis protein DltB [Oscillospiraceae bacterium]|jgi:membrane protein involved in D-alanine export|nr:D-alanyl-lipoteichoic acid biosynthesis protein DltB [Oscillospiraceae bacterium]